MRVLSLILTLLFFSMASFSQEKIVKVKMQTDSIDYYKRKSDSLLTHFQTSQKKNDILEMEVLKKDLSLNKYKFIIYSFSLILFLGIFLWYFFRNKRKQIHELELLENSIKLKEIERNIISKELHGNIANSLVKLVHESKSTNIKLSSKLLQTYHEVRNLSHSLYSPPLIPGELFFDVILDIIPDSTDKEQFSFDIIPRHLQINEPYGTHIFRITQELITNNLKYANATLTQINITLKKETLILIYKDNGVGSSDFKKGYGYKNIEDRLTLMNGTLQIEHKNGFSVIITIPYFV